MAAWWRGQSPVAADRPRPAASSHPRQPGSFATRRSTATSAALAFNDRSTRLTIPAVKIMVPLVVYAWLSGGSLAQRKTRVVATRGQLSHGSWLAQFSGKSQP